MPIYRFHCTACKYEEKKLMNHSDAEKFSGGCICGHPLSLALSAPEVRSMETADEYRDKKVVSGVKEMVDERAKDHFRKVDLPKMIAEKGIEWAKTNGFVDEDGKPK